MPDSELHKKLSELHSVLARMSETDSIDTQARLLLAELQRDIEAVLDREHEGTGQSGGVSDQLTNLVQHFESDHPALAGALGAVADQLAKLGI